MKDASDGLTRTLAMVRKEALSLNKTSKKESEEIKDEKKEQNTQGL